MRHPLSLRHRLGHGFARQLARIGACAGSGPAMIAGTLALCIAGPAAADRVFAPVASEILSGIRNANVAKIPATSGYGAPTIAIRSFAKNEPPGPGSGRQCLEPAPAGRTAQAGARSVRICRYVFHRGADPDDRGIKRYGISESEPDRRPEGEYPRRHTGFRRNNALTGDTATDLSSPRR